MSVWEEVDEAIDEAEKKMAREGYERPKSLAVYRPSAQIPKTPAIRKPHNGWGAGKLVRKEQERQWGIEQGARRSALTMQCVAALAVYGVQQVDHAQEAILAQYRSKARDPRGNEIMAQATEEILQAMQESIVGLVKNFHYRIREDI